MSESMRSGHYRQPITVDTGMGKSRTDPKRGCSAKIGVNAARNNPEVTHVLPTLETQPKPKKTS